jgi:hypothetical protein
VGSPRLSAAALGEELGPGRAARLVAARECSPSRGLVNQAKGKEWNAVGVRFKPSQIARIRDGLSETNADDRALYVALTRAHEMVCLNAVEEMLRFFTITHIGR